jgi:hypothetical protein
VSSMSAGIHRGEVRLRNLERPTRLTLVHRRKGMTWLRPSIARASGKKREFAWRPRQSNGSTYQWRSGSLMSTNQMSSSFSSGRRALSSARMRTRIRFHRAESLPTTRNSQGRCVDVPMALAISDSSVWTTACRIAAIRLLSLHAVCAPATLACPLSRIQAGE